MDSSRLKKSKTKECFTKNPGLRINRPLSYDDLRQIIRTDEKKVSVSESIKKKSKRLSFETFSNSTLSNTNWSQKFEHPQTTKNYLITDYSVGGFAKVSPKEVIKKKFEFFENLQRPEGRLAPKKVFEEFFNTNEEKLERLITMSVLSKATEVVGKNGVENLSLSYVRQLRQFCNEVIKAFEKR